jgi:hypothetical protein
MRSRTFREGGTAYGGGAIFNIVGFPNIHVGKVVRANNVEDGSSREASQERRELQKMPF